MTPKAVIFDLDGTLANTLADIVSSVNDTLRLYDRPDLDSVTVKSHIGDGPDFLIRRILPELSSNDRQEATKKYLEFSAIHCAEKVTLMPGAAEVLDFLSDLPLAVVTNKVSEGAEQNLDVLGIRDRFDIVFGYDSPFPPKPSPATLLHVCEQFKVDVSDAAMVGDGMPDIHSSRSAGIDCYSIMDGFTAKERLLAENPTFAVETIADVIEMWNGKQA